MFSLQAYRAKGIKQMYPWQAAALECGEAGNNLVYCAPTSGGKTLVAELLMIKRLMATRRHVEHRFTRASKQAGFRLGHNDNSGS